MMQVVIDIPEEMYKNIQSGNFWLDSGLTLSNAYDFIKNGTPLPKGHGRLIDADALEYDTATLETDSDIQYEFIYKEDVADAPTIIEADKESEDIEDMELKIGHWTWVQDDNNPNIGNWHCSECNSIVRNGLTDATHVYLYEYCPSCKAKME